MFKLIETYDDGFRDYEVFRCEYDGFTVTIPAGADIACCPKCEARDAEQEAREEGK